MFGNKTPTTLARSALGCPVRERELFNDNLLVRIHFILEVIWWTGLAPFPFSRSPCIYLPGAPPEIGGVGLHGPYRSAPAETKRGVDAGLNRGGLVARLVTCWISSLGLRVMQKKTGPARTEWKVDTGLDCCGARPGCGCHGCSGEERASHLSTQTQFLEDLLARD